MNMNFVWGGRSSGEGIAQDDRRGGGGGGDFELHTPETQHREQLSCVFVF